jgi:hypothetical protein
MHLQITNISAHQSTLTHMILQLLYVSFLEHSKQVRTIVKVNAKGIDNNIPPQRGFGAFSYNHLTELN